MEASSKIKTRISVAKKKKEITDYQTSFIRCMSLRIYCGNALALLHHCWWHYFCLSLHVPIAKITKIFAYQTKAYQINMNIYFSLSTIYFCLSRFLPIINYAYNYFISRMHLQHTNQTSDFLFTFWLIFGKFSLKKISPEKQKLITKSLPKSLKKL